ncbi:MAG: eukaryotic-like serine/threonine-protein kinase [Blastocatellia bacterium]|jgi:serine/threonine-protein kinase|nr:eukaryotic-like serine/threonine-protein kinase [Blastocatellia bacterium]
MALTAGSSISQYKIIARLGSGGMGEVYLAQDERLRRKVALKLLFEEVTKNEDWVRRFEQEAYAASALNHPNIITIYEVGQMGDSHFISTEFIDGQTLRERLRQNTLTVSEALDIAVQVVSALVAAHTAGIIHRDIKPENVMLRPDGYIKVLDFGLAKFTEQRAYGSAPIDKEAETEAAVNTSPGVVMGTVSYMSPEQARGAHVDARTDIFSLGVLLYEMLSGRLPFEGASPSEIIVSIIQKRQRPLARYTPEIPQELERIVAKSLSKNRDDRYQSLKDMLIDLKRLKRQLELEAAQEDELDEEAVDLPPPVSGRQSVSRSGPARAATGQQIVADTHLTLSHPSSAQYIVSGIKRHKKVALISVAVAMAAIVGLSYYFFSRPQIDSIAVLPFSMVNSDPAMEQLSDDIAQRVINDLSQMSGLRIMPFNVVQQYKGKQVDPAAVGRELDVRAVLLGRIFKRDNSYVVSVELIDTRDRRQLWGVQRPVKLSDYTLVPEEIVTSISNAVGVKVSAEEKKKRDAEMLYVKGRSAWNKRTTDGINEATRNFEQALELYPNYALAYAGLADCYNMLGTYGAKAPKEVFPKAHDAAIKSLAIDNNLAEGHAALAYATFRGDWKWPEAEKEFKQAISLNDNYASVHQWYANYLAAQGRFDEAIKETRRTQEIDKTSLIINAHFGLVYYLAHRFDESIAECKKAIDLDPSFFVARRYMGLSYAQKGMYKEAIAEFEKAVSASSGSPLMRAEYANTLALSGDTNKAQAELNNLIEMSNQKYISAYHIAAIYVGLKDKDHAFEWLEKAFQDRADWMAFLKVDPRFDSLKSDPRFTNLLHRMNLG